MRIVTVHKPVKFVGRTKYDVINKIRDRFRMLSFAMYGGNYLNVGKAGYYKDERSVVVLVNLEKQRRKVERKTRTITRGKNKGQVVVEKTDIRPNQWIAFVYALPVEIVAEARQHARRFDVKFKNGSFKAR